MAERPQAQDPSGLSTQFRSALQDLSDESSFVVVRTPYAVDSDEAQWAAALVKLRAYATPDEDDAEMDPDTLKLPPIADCIVLHEDEERPSDVRREALILVDEPALTSLLKAPDFVTGKVLNLHSEPWVAAVDAKGPASVSGGGGGLYMGFTRSRARSEPAGRYKFPQGTPRGANGAQAMLEKIARAIGTADGSGS
ncbi:hypothetical protein BDP81DRAFT_460740 [Colletotrichum phormii]|uniref:Uncharacterized protein n=1 Tax=Colletotrichum phormii TaxID=359342 RepID=A0AAJ0EFN3_9PEZI|nr:uncharacterized protein BDP81DRAFT_460740 [Colletotrichum phormii]KAK1637163.1 hypothetical protein BDP81DRAFT_460740 [Colletotrichum phormii]